MPSRSSLHASIALLCLLWWLLRAGMDTAALRELAAIEAILKQRGINVAKQLQATKQERGKRKYQPPPDADTLDPLTWTERYRRLEGRPLSFHNHKPLRAIYQDDHPTIVVLKPAQVGVSEMAVSRTLHALDVGAAYYKSGKQGLNVGYLFPTGRALSDFSKERFTGIMDEHPHIREMFSGGFDDIGFKQVGQHSYLYMRSTYTSGKGHHSTADRLTSFPADVLVLDEYDRMDPVAVEQARKRMRASPVKRELNISTPTLPARGIHLAYLHSDQRVWEVPCPECGVWFEMEFFRDVRGEDTWTDAQTRGPQAYDTWRDWERERLLAAHWTVHCPVCMAEVDRAGEGRWRVTRPEVTSVHGYHVPALAFPIVELSALAVHATSSDPTQIEEFYRSDLGIPYEPPGSVVTDAMLDALAVRDIPRGPYVKVTMGVDVGARFHCRVSAELPDPTHGTSKPLSISYEQGAPPDIPRGQRVVLEMVAVRTWEEVDQLMRKWNVRRCVVDAGPELHGSAAFQQRHKGKVFRAYYGKGKGSELFTLQEKDGTVTINRTMAMDAVYERLVDGAELWPASVIHNPEVRANLKAPSRVLTTDSQGQPVVVWTHTAPDHFFHANVYDYVASLLRPPPSRPGVVLASSTKGWGTDKR